MWAAVSPPLRGGDSGRRSSLFGRVALIAAILLLLPSLAAAQGVTVTATHARKTPLKLSETARVTLVVEGPAPLAVELPRPAKADAPPESALLAEESDHAWGVQFVGRPRVMTEGGRTRWEQDFRLEPFVPGDWVVAFAPLRVNGREVDGPRVALSVDPSKVTEPQDPTGIESLPPLPPAPASAAPLWWAAGGLAAACVLIVARQLRARPPPVSPAARAAAAFDRLERDAPAGAVLAARVADVLREFVERRFGLPATKLTTAELLAAAGEQAVWSVVEADALRRVLNRCDRYKFAGDVPDDDGCRGLIAAGREWVEHVSAAGAGPG